MRKYSLLKVFLFWFVLNPLENRPGSLTTCSVFLEWSIILVIPISVSLMSDLLSHLPHLLTLCLNRLSASFMPSYTSHNRASACSGFQCHAHAGDQGRKSVRGGNMESKSQAEAGQDIFPVPLIYMQYPASHLALTFRSSPSTIPVRPTQSNVTQDARCFLTF